LLKFPSAVLTWMSFYFIEDHLGSGDKMSCKPNSSANQSRPDIAVKHMAADL